MQRYSFMEREAMKERDIPSFVKEKYGIKIDATSLYESDIIYKKAEQVLDKSLNRKYIDGLYKVGDEECEKSREIKHLRNVISDLIDKISEIDFFIPDIKADCLMGLLYSDEECDVWPDEKMEWGWGATDEEDRKRFRKVDNFERIRNAQRHYPYAKYETEGFPLNGIPGGCEEYHKLMMNQKNISIFDTSISKEDKNISIFDIGINKEKKNISIKKYGFQKAHDIYEELKNAPVENLLLLEKTLGIGYANQLFYYVNSFTDFDRLSQLKEVIKSCVGVPMFARKYVTNKLWGYLKATGYNSFIIQYIEEVGYLLACLVDEAYEAVLELYWYVYYLTYWNDCLHSSILLDIENYWKQYFDEETVYSNILESEKIHDWRGIKDVEDCFFPGEDGYRIEKTKLLDNKIEYVPIMLDDNGGYFLAVQAPFKALGKDILEITAQRLNEKICFYDEIQNKMRSNIELDKVIKNYEITKGEQAIDQNLQDLYRQFNENNKELLDLYYDIRRASFVELKKNEEEIWKDKDVKVGAQKLKPLHIYALIHAEIVRLLNE